MSYERELERLERKAAITNALEEYWALVMLVVLTAGGIAADVLYDMWIWEMVSR